MDIRLYDEKDGVTKLGPGTRYVIWTQGCPRKCYHCMTPESQNPEGGYLEEVGFLARKVIHSGREGITISGGEPFLQAAALTELIRQVRQERDIGVMIYTGYIIAQLREARNSDYESLLSLCDLLIDGPYIEALNDGKMFRGSSNQHAIFLTHRYEDFAKEFGAGPSEVEFFYDMEKIYMVGVPSREILEKMEKIKF